MKKSVRFWVFSLLTVMMLALAACGGGGTTAPAAKKAPAAPASGGETKAAGGVTIELGIKGEELAFDKDKLSVKAAKGEKITIKFTNTSKTQQHNLTLLNHNDKAKAEKFDAEAAKVTEGNAYYPEDNAEMKATVIAHIKTQDPGKSESVTFDSPGPGEYMYVCTVPGHFAAGDYGTLTIQ